MDSFAVAAVSSIGIACLEAVAEVEIPSQRLIFVLGKGGVGRTTTATSLGYACAARGESTLLVQWALADSVSPLFQRPVCGHKPVELSSNLWTMNYRLEEAMREYFVEHLKARLAYRFVIENHHVQRVLYAAPGLAELFFLGRLFWVLVLAQDAGRRFFDRIIVDAPAMGHGATLFSIPRTVAEFGLGGPIVKECARVAALLADGSQVGAIVVTLPDAIPIQETLEFLPRIERDLGRAPLCVVVNRAPQVSGMTLNSFSEIQFSSPNGEIDVISAQELLFKEMTLRITRGVHLQEELAPKIPTEFLPDLFFLEEKPSPRAIVRILASCFASGGARHG